MKSFMAWVAVLFGVMAKAEPLDPKFFANESFLKAFPGATVLHPNSSVFLERSLAKTFSDAQKLIDAVQAIPALVGAIRNFPRLSVVQRTQTMHTLFDIQVSKSGAFAPILILDDNAKRSTFFDFDPKRPDSGKVILNPTKLFADSNPHAALLFLVHETRHAAQFQMAFHSKTETASYLSEAYKIGFSAQRDIFDHSHKVSFCDFLTLNQEYEAFLFGNIVMEMLGEGAVNTSDMGTLASQYALNKGLRLDLPALAKQVGSDRLLDAFNELEKAQYGN